jgi:DNA-directed RNA polymerase alpha subunit
MGEPVKFRLIMSDSETYIIDDERSAIIAIVEDPDECRKMVALANRERVEDRPVDDNILLRRIDEVFEFTTRVMNVLDNDCLPSAQRISLVGQLVQKTERELLRLKNFGRGSLREVRTSLAAKGLTLGMKIDDWDERLRNRFDFGAYLP